MLYSKHSTALKRDEKIKYEIFCHSVSNAHPTLRTRQGALTIELDVIVQILS